MLDADYSRSTEHFYSCLEHTRNEWFFVWATFLIILWVIYRIGAIAICTDSTSMCFCSFRLSSTLIAHRRSANSDRFVYQLTRSLEFCCCRIKHRSKEIGNFSSVIPLDNAPEIRCYISSSIQKHEDVHTNQNLFDTFGKNDLIFDSVEISLVKPNVCTKSLIGQTSPKAILIWRMTV